MAKNPMFSLNILMIGTRATGKTTYLTCTYGRSSDGALFDDGKCKVTLDLANEGSNVSQKSVATPLLSCKILHFIGSHLK